MLNFVYEHIIHYQCKTDNIKDRNNKNLCRVSCIFYERKKATFLFSILYEKEYQYLYKSRNIRE